MRGLRPSSQVGNRELTIRYMNFVSKPSFQIFFGSPST